MLEQLVASSGHRRESRKFRAFFLGTAVLVLVACFSVFVWSIMAAELTLTDDGLELSAMIAPVPIPAVEPPKPEPQQPQQRQEEQQVAKSEVATRHALIERVDDSTKIPDKISVTPSTEKERPKDGAVKITSGPETDAIGRPGTPRGNTGEGGVSDSEGTGGTNNISNVGEDKPPVMAKKDPAPVKHPPISGGVLNGQARSLPRPPYPAPAKLMNISDSVSVQVVIDEQGNVISAHAVSGHQLLRPAAEQAARQAKFGPTLLTGQAVKVTGVIIYKFSNG